MSDESVEFRERMTILEEFAKKKLASLQNRSLRRRLVETDRREDAAAFRLEDGSETQRKALISFCCNDYLNLSQHPAVKRAAIEATEVYGTGAGASRLITGNHPLFAQLEKRLAKIKGTEDAVVFGSGYLANIGIIPSLIGAQDVIFIDELAHACLFGGAQLSAADQFIFRHNACDHLESVLAEHRSKAGNALILTDGVFSMDGDLAPLPDLAALADKYDAWLMTDDAHGLGVVGDGHGSKAAFDGASLSIPLQMGTLSKAVGSYGGYLCASHAVAELIRNRARSFVYTTGLPPASVAASIAALDIIASDKEFCAQPVRQATVFTDRIGLPQPQSPIVPLIVGDADATLKASHMLEAEGFLVTAIRPPTVPTGTSRLRFTFTASHRDEDILRLADFVRTHILPMRSDQ